jgi:hypothetical protein
VMVGCVGEKRIADDDYAQVGSGFRIIQLIHVMNAVIADSEKERIHVCRC